MTKGNYLTSLLRSNKTVFSSNDIAMLWHETTTNATRVRLHYFVEKGELYRIRKGLYAKNEQYNRLELATRVLSPSYVSFETVLVKEGLIFQYYAPIFIASYTTREITIDQQIYSIRKIKYEILVNATGIDHVNETSIATKERAFLDMLYIDPHFYFDNLRSLDWDKVFDLLPIYTNQRLDNMVKEIHNREGNEAI